MELRLPVPTDPDARRVLDRQVVLMLQLAGDVLADVTLDECRWTISDRSWTVHERDGEWFGELDEETPDLPTPSLGWTMWHPVWWLSALLAHTRGDEAPSHDVVPWPGPEASLTLIGGLWAEWIAVLDSLSEEQLHSSELTRFPYDDHRPFVHVAGWASMELTKNLSEMCLLRRVGADLRRP